MIELNPLRRRPATLITGSVARARRVRPALLLLVIVMCMALVGGSWLTLSRAEAADRVIEIPASEMTFVRQGAPSTNYAGYPDTIASNAEYRTLLKFDTSAIASSTVVTASLQVTVTTSRATRPGLDVRPIGTDWTTARVTWASMPAPGAVRLNAGDVAIAYQNQTIDSELGGLVGSTPGSALGFAVSYLQPGTPVNLSKQVVPVLRLTVRGASDPVSSPTPTPIESGDPSSPSPTPSPQPDRFVDLTATGIAFVNGNEPTKNYLGYDGVVSQREYRTYLKFDGAAVPVGTNVVAASLDLAVVSATATAPALDVRSTTTAWSEQTVTSANAPAGGATQLNPMDSAIARSGQRLSPALTGLVGTTVGSGIGLQLRYLQLGAQAQIARSPMPVLHLIVRAGPVATRQAVDQSMSWSTTPLPYAAAAPGSSPRKVFAHYFPPFPVSLDNVPPASDYYTRGWMTPQGDNGAYAAVGGLLRDRPTPRNPLGGDYRYTDAKREVRQASAAGIDGFLTDILEWGSGSWDGSMRVLRAASELDNGFTVAPNIDMASSKADVSVRIMAAYLHQFYAQPAAYKTPRGHYLLSAVAADAKPVSYWVSLKNELRRTYATSVDFVPVLLDPTDAKIKTYAPISYGIGSWGSRSAAQVAASDRGTAVHKKGLTWMAPVVVQDERPKSRSYAEAGNTDLLRASWKRAIDDHAEMVQMITWNDYSESTGFAPSVAHGTSFLDVSGYYATQFKQGKAPTLTGDELVVTHRVQSVQTQPRRDRAAVVSTLGGSSTKPRDTVEVLCLCKAAATVELTVGGRTTSFAAPAGVSVHTVPLLPGTVSAKAVRGTATVATVTSAHPVESSIDWWDLQYWAASSR